MEHGPGKDTNRAPVYNHSLVIILPIPVEIMNDTANNSLINLMLSSMVYSFQEDMHRRRWVDITSTTVERAEC